MSTTRETVEYYANLLILQYIGKVRAYATELAQATPVVMPQTSVQTIAFSAAPTSGSFTLSYNDITTSVVWNTSVGAIQTQLQGIAGLEQVLVTGSIAGLLLTVTFVGVTAPALPLILTATTLMVSGNLITPVIAETDLTLPLAVQDGFNLTGTDTAVGAQLDILGKYAGVTRTGYGFTAQITLNDADFLRLILMAIVKNSSGSSLADIVGLLNQFFPGEWTVFDQKTMQIYYFISSTFGSQDLIQLIVTEGLLPVPMAVNGLIVFNPSIVFFGFRTYTAPPVNVYPFNTYASFSHVEPWLSYADIIVPP